MDINLGHSFTIESDWANDTLYISCDNADFNIMLTVDDLKRIYIVFVITDETNQNERYLFIDDSAISILRNRNIEDIDYKHSFITNLIEGFRLLGVEIKDRL